MCIFYSSWLMVNIFLTKKERMRQLKITKSITNRDSKSIEKYLQEISREDMVTPEEEVKLAKQIKNGDQDALERLVKANLRFVVSVAKQYQNSSLSLNDLINEGNFGLVKAAQRFDETRGFKFISYAVWWIRQSIMQALAEQSRMVRLPLNKVGSLTKINHAASKLEQHLEREPTPDELSEVLEIQAEEINTTVNLAGRHISMDAPFVEGEFNSLINVMEDKDAKKADAYLIHHHSLSIETERTLAILDDREKIVVKCFFGIEMEHPLSLSDIGEKIGLTRERVRQIKDNALQKLRTSNKSKLLMSYLGN